MAGAIDIIAEAIAKTILPRMSEGAVERVGAMMLAKTIIQPGGEYAQREAFERCTEYVRTGRWEVEDPEAERYPYPSGEITILGPQIFASTEVPAENTVICWQGENFVPQRDPVGPDPAFAEVLDHPDDPGPVEEGWRPEGAALREPAPMAGTHWQGRRGG